MPLSWKDYVNIRRIDEQLYFERHDIRNYAQLVSRINKGDVTPPLESEVAHLFVKDPVVTENSSKVEKVVRVSSLKEKNKTTPKKTTAKSSQKTDISKRAKPRTRKASTRTRKKTTKK